MKKSELQELVIEAIIAEVGEANSIVFDYTKEYDDLYTFTTDTGKEIDVDFEDITDNIAGSNCDVLSNAIEANILDNIYTFSYSADGKFGQGEKSTVSELLRILSTVSEIGVDFADNISPQFIHVTAAPRDKETGENDSAKMKIYKKILSNKLDSNWSVIDNCTINLKKGGSKTGLLLYKNN